MAWNDLAFNELPTNTDLDDAVTLGELQYSGDGTGITGGDPTECRTAFDIYSFIDMDGLPSEWTPSYANSELPYKQHILDNRHLDSEPNAPFLLEIIKTGHQFVEIEWQNDADGPATDSNNVYRATTSTPPGSPTYVDVTSPFKDTGLTNGTEYFYWVTAVNQFGESELSNMRSATPQAPTETPNNFSGSQTSTDPLDIELTWTNPIEHELELEVWRADSSFWQFLATLPENTTTYNHTNIDRTQHVTASSTVDYRLRYTGSSNSVTTSVTVV